MSKSLLGRLKKNHGLISRLIAKQQGSKLYDPLILRELKKARLTIKDRIARIEAAAPLSHDLAHGYQTLSHIRITTPPL